MLTYTPNPKPKRKDRPWLLFLMALIWISGSCFFHDPWEPYEPYVVSIVKSIIENPRAPGILEASRTRIIKIIMLTMGAKKSVLNKSPIICMKLSS